MTKRRLWVVEIKRDGEWLFFEAYEDERKKAAEAFVLNANSSKRVGLPFRVVSYEPSPKVTLKLTGEEVVSLGKPSR